ncbi:MAG TPA: sugar-transfer associated ATP-grasp domain-containing protein [Vitreimonas sp.]|nr:sugar-transfer associated ATP-grasp domain-containing protein [Vitreimonas sp.]
MVKPRDILGMNARERIYGKLNPASSRAFCSSKYATKVLLENKGIPTATIYGVLTNSEDVNEFDWVSLEKNFVIKPTNGNAGKGVAIFRKQHVDKYHWTDAIGKTWDLDDIKLHCFDILDGLYSTYGAQHHIIVEERVPIHPTLLKYVYKGTPDIRVIVFNHVPVMCMLRLPTVESEGRANLHQGAIAAGIDIATGVTTYAITGSGQSISILPDTKRKLNGIKIPNWKKLLEVAVQASDAAGLVYGGVDLFVHEEKGPLVVELNANPGLSIQNANKAGLRRRLERVQDIEVLNPEHGVRIAQALFASVLADKIKAEDGLIIVPYRDNVTVYGDNKQKIEVEALMNTGRFRSAIASNLASQLGLIDLEDLLWFQQETDEGRAPVVEVNLKIKNRKLKTAMVVSKRLNKSAHKLEIGRHDLDGFLVGENE